MQGTRRWFGPQEPISLDQIKKPGAMGIISALYHIYRDEPWPPDEVCRTHPVRRREPCHSQNRECRKWIEAGAVAVGVGGDLMAGAKTSDHASIATLA